MIWDEVRLPRPKDLAEMMDVALLAEEKLGLGKFGGYVGKKYQNFNKSSVFRNWSAEPGSKQTNSVNGDQSKSAA